jgi:hypothetical protein
MLDVRFKNLCLVYSFIRCEQASVVVGKKQKKKSLFLMFLKCHYLLHPLAKFEYLPNKMNDKDCNWNIFKVILKTSEPTNQCGIFNFPTLSRM